MSAVVDTRPVLQQWPVGRKHSGERLIFEIMVKHIGRVSCLSEKKSTRINANLGDFDRLYINEDLIVAKPDSTPSVVTMKEKIVLSIVWVRLGACLWE